jgi:hypothetical protein
VLIFWIAMGSFVLAIPLLYWASGRFPPAWRWLWAYVGAMSVAALVVTLSAGGIGTA